MKAYQASGIRNVALMSHGGAGKTSLTEAMLFSSGAITRLGRVEDGNTISDWDPDEAKRGMSINTSIAPVEWRDHKINVLDTPGYADFTGEVISAAAAVDSAVIVLDASSGVEVGTEYAWRYADDRNLPRIMVVNKIDRENANFANALASAQAAFGNSVAPLYIPIGQESSFSGVVDLLAMKALTFASDGSGDWTEGDVPAELLDEAETRRLELVEIIAENDEELMMKYLEDEELTVDELRAGLKAAVASGDVVPVIVTAATTNRGPKLLLDALVDLAPPPGPIAAQDASGEVIELAVNDSDPVAVFVWKTIADPFVGKLSYFRVISGTLKSDCHLLNANQKEDERIGQVFTMRGKEQLNVPSLSAGDIGAVSKLVHTRTGDTLCDPSRPVTLPPIEFPQPLFDAAVSPRTKADLDKMGQALARLAEEDPTITVRRDGESGETILSGLGESHIQIALEKVARKFGVNVDFELPTVPYRETILKKVEGVEYKHKKQTGGHGQYGHVFLTVEPIAEGFEFAESIFGGAVPRNFIPAVEKGVREAMEEGVLAGFPVTNVKVTLTDGSYHSVDSSEMAFKLAASQAFKRAQEMANPVLLEPINKIAVTIPESYTGDVMSDLTTKRAHVSGMTPGENGYTTIEATVPAAEIQRYATDLRSITQGRGTFTTEFSHYDQVPAHLTESIIAARKQREEALV
ncbi:MAG TPA: elongation factor G [Thermomicrobiales bacterium]|nr:elongation factor G [Thermomicrobiales bacterium]